MVENVSRVLFLLFCKKEGCFFKLYNEGRVIERIELEKGIYLICV